MQTVKTDNQHNTTRSRWHSHRHKELKILAETCMASMKRLVCRYPWWQHINWQPVWIPGSQHVSTFSWCFLCYSLKIEILMLTTKVCFDSHAFRWAAMSCQFYPAFVIQWRFSFFFFEGVARLFRYFKGTLLDLDLTIHFILLQFVHRFASFQSL